MQTFIISNWHRNRSILRDEYKQVRKRLRYREIYRRAEIRNQSRRSSSRQK